MPKRTKKKTPTKGDIKKALAQFFPGSKIRLTKEVPPTVVTPSAKYTAKIERRKLTNKPKVKIPARYNKALVSYGLGYADKAIDRHGRFYAAKAVYELKRFKVKPTKKGLSAAEQKPFKRIIYKPTATPGWSMRYVDGRPDKKRTRTKEAERKQWRERKAEKIRRIAVKTGNTTKGFKKILSKIRAEERANISRFKASKKFKALPKWRRKKVTLRNRMVAIFQTMCDLLEVQDT